MTVYPDINTTMATWDEPIETIWQNLSSPSALRGQRRADLGLVERLLIGAVMNTPRERREWGMVNWLSQVYRTSRPTLYQIGAWAQCLGDQPAGQRETEVVEPRGVVQGRVSPNRLKRTMLTLSVPGKVSRRRTRSPGRSRASAPTWSLLCLATSSKKCATPSR